MTLLVPHRFSPVIARGEIKEFGAFLQANEFFNERDCVSLLKTLPNLTTLIGTLGTGMILAESFKYEFRIQGVVAADLVLANKTKSSAMFIEFEGGARHSAFSKTSTNQLPNWSREIEHATGQIIDWAWAISDAANSALWEHNIGMRSFSAQYFVICGREGSLFNELARKRFGFRRNLIAVAGNRIVFLTYDEVFRELDYALTELRTEEP
jgi:hypothetical protein